MTKRMLIDASHAEETRVVVLDGNRLEDFDVETATKRQLKGNIYLAKIVRVEPSLQAAFVEYGGNRHGFLAFGEIHPDYYQIPVADRQRLLAMQEQEAREDEEDEEREARGQARRPREAPPVAEALRAAREEVAGEFPASGAPDGEEADGGRPDGQGPDGAEPVDASVEAATGAREVPAAEVLAEAGHHPLPDAPPADHAPAPGGGDEPFGAPEGRDGMPAGAEAHEASEAEVAGRSDAALADGWNGAATDGMASEDGGGEADEAESAEPPPETLGGRGTEERGEERAERRTPRFLRNYKIQEVIRRRQILLIQVVKEERGTKGAALTTYISLAGRFSVLMPNSPRGGGVSRKITSAADRRRLKEITAELDLPRGMGMIVRTAGAQRPKPEITRDGEYLLRLWDDIREHTLRSTAPALIYEEASLIKRAIRDVYSRDVDEVLVDGEDGWRAARDYMRMLMPAHARKVQLWQGHGASAGQALFAAERVEAQLDAMLSPSVQLRSGGYLVIDQTEALVAIDVNSGRSTRERGIEETALRTNLEAADEVARQLRLRDLAGLIVIDFIDMEARRHNAAVEKRLKDALREDRARIQLGSISHFGLMEMSRQRLRPSLAETAFVACPACGGTGHVRSTESACLHVLRAIEEVGARRQAAEVVVHVAPATVLYILNHKRARVAEIEARYAMSVGFAADAALQPAQHRIDKLRPQLAPLPAPVFAGQSATVDPTDELEVEEPDVQEEVPVEAEAPEAAGDARRRRRRRRPGRRDEAAAEESGAGPQEAASEQQASEQEAAGQEVAGQEAAGGAPAGDAEPAEVPASAAAPADADPASEATDESAGEEGARRRRGRRGGRRRRREEDEASAPAPDPIPMPTWSGPTPADPFGAPVLDIFEMAELAEQRAAEAAAARAAPPQRVEPSVPSMAQSLGVLGEPEAAAPPAAQAPTESPAPSGPEAMAPEAMAGEVDASAIDAPAHDAVGPEPATDEGADRVASPSAAIPPEEQRPEAVAAPLEDVPPPAPEPVTSAPPIQPILVGAGAAPEKKRGWWRR